MKIVSTKYIKWFVKHDPESCARGFGWGCGYIALGRVHPWYGIDYDSIDQIDIFGNYDYLEIPYLTYSNMGEDEYEGMWIVGFDTFNGSYKDYYKDDVIKATKKLFEIALNVKE